VYRLNVKSTGDYWRMELMSRKMKGSGIEWIGEIPEEWNLTKIGSIYQERSTKVSDKEYSPLSVTKNGIVPQLETAAKTDNGDNRKLVKIDDFIINSRSDRRGSCGISSYEGSVSLINTVLKSKNDIDNLFYNYVFKSENFADEFYRWGNGIVDDLWSTKWSNMKRIYIPHPDIEEQNRIATYLDKKTIKIDETIEKQKQVIEKLKEYRESVITEAVTKGLNPDVPMKDSGIEWIGQIPEHWQINKLLWTCSKIGDTDHRMPEATDEGIPYVSPTDFYGINEIDFNNAKKITLNSFKEISQKIKPQKDDIIFARYATIGTIRLIETDIDFLVSYSCVVIKPNQNKINSKFLYYYLKSNAIVQEAKYYINSNTQCNIGIDSIQRFKITVPELNEQKEITVFLDDKCSKIDNVIAKKESLIEKLTEYKKSLIYECVTGKKEINIV
jgi:type I restriction enzyme S subunit